MSPASSTSTTTTFTAATSELIGGLLHAIDCFHDRANGGAYSPDRIVLATGEQGVFVDELDCLHRRGSGFRFGRAIVESEFDEV